MNYKTALAQASKVGAKNATGDAWLAQAVSVITLPHPGLNPEMVYKGALKRGLTPLEVAKLDGFGLDDLMWA